MPYVLEKGEDRLFSLNSDLAIRLGAFNNAAQIIRYLIVCNIDSDIYQIDKWVGV